MVDDEGVAGGALALGPAELLGEVDFGVGEEELRCVSRHWRQVRRGRIEGGRLWKWVMGDSTPELGVSGKGTLTISSLIPFAFPQALMTKALLKAMQATISTPFPFNESSLSIYDGRWRPLQPGVKAPGTAKRTTFLSAHSVCC